MTARISLIAHASTKAQQIAAFPLDEAVNEREPARIARLSLTVPSANRAWSGPEQRAQQTSRILGLSAQVANELRDCDYGRWRGKTMESAQTEDPNGMLAWFTDPAATPHGGESIDHVIARIGKWLDGQIGTKHTIGVTHPAVIRAAIVYALGLPSQNFWRFDVAPLTITDLRFSRDAWTVRCCGCPLRVGTSEGEPSNT